MRASASCALRRNRPDSERDSSDENEFGIHAAAPFGDGNSSIVRSRWLERKLIGKFAQPIGDSVPVEELAPFQVGFGVVGRHPVGNGIDVEVGFLGEMRLADDHLAGREEAGDEVTDHGVQVELFGVESAIHFRIGKENLGRAAFDNNIEEARLLQFLDRLCSEDHGGSVLAPGLFGLHDVVADHLVSHEQPRLVHEKGFESGESVPVADLLRGAMEHIEQQGFQQIRRIAPTAEVEGLKPLEGKRVLGVVEKETVLAGARPAVETILQFAHDAGEIREGSLVGR